MGMDLQKVKKALECAGMLLAGQSYHTDYIEEALAELEKPAVEDATSVAKQVFDIPALDFSEWLDAADGIIQQYAEAYHARKCGECVDDGQKSPCDFCDSDSCPDCPVYNQEDA